MIEVASVTLPFLLDSIRMELSRLNLVLSDVQQCLMGVHRQGKNLLLSDELEVNESLIRLEIESAGAPKDLVARIYDVMDLVKVVVDDFSPMRKQLLLWSDHSQFEMGGGETYELLKWFYANNFTFLGYEEFKPVLKTSNKENKTTSKTPGKTAGKIEAMQVIASSRLGLARPNKSADALPVNISRDTIFLEKLPVRSRVHRPAYLDAVTICERQGNTIKRVCRFIGLFTANVYNQDPKDIPVVREKMDRIFAARDVVASSHKGRELNRIIEILPREELFFATSEDLRSLVDQIFSLQERRVVRVLCRQDSYFVNCIVYVPKDIYSTTLRVEMQAVLVRAFNAFDVEFYTQFTESALTRTHFVMRANQICDVDLDAIEAEITELTRTWADGLQQKIVEKYEQKQASRLTAIYRDVFSLGYQADFSLVDAAEDIDFLEQLSVERPLTLKFYETSVNGKIETHFRIFHLGAALPLSDVIPILENLGAKTIEQHPYELHRDEQEIWVHDFLLDLVNVPKSGLQSLRGIFELSLIHI